MSVKTINLTPCSCGDQPEIRSVGDDKQYFACFCSKCGKTAVHYNEARMTKRGAIKIWNRRVNVEKI